MRPPWRIAEVRRLTLTRWPERRRLLWTRLERPDGLVLAVANDHATAHLKKAAARDVRRAAEQAVAWAGSTPLLFGGDLNISPARAAPVFQDLADRLGFTRPAEADAIDHLLARGLDVVEPPRRLPPSAREVDWLGQPTPGAARLALRLSDHAPVVGCFRLESPARGSSRAPS